MSKVSREVNIGDINIHASCYGESEKPVIIINGLIDECTDARVRLVPGVSRIVTLTSESRAT